MTPEQQKASTAKQMTADQRAAIGAMISSVYKAAIPEVLGAVWDPANTHVAVHVLPADLPKVTREAETLKLAERFAVPIQIVPMG